MKEKGLVLIAITLVLIFLTGQVVSAQDGETGTDSSDSEGGSVLPEIVSAITPGAIPIQGRLTNASGTPLTGDYGITFNLYEVETGGTPLCGDYNLVTVTNGVFNSYIDGCYDFLTGQKVWLGIRVGSDPEMTPRQVIMPVPYAITLKPGASLIGDMTPNAIIHAVNTNPTGRALRGYATSPTGVNYGVVGSTSSPSGYGGYFSNSGGGIGLWGFTSDTATAPAIFGCVNTAMGNCIAGTNPAGVTGKSNVGDGILGMTDAITNRGVYAQNAGGGVALAAYASSTDTTNHNRPTAYLVQADATGDFIVGAGSYYGTRYWRVDRTGKGFFNGGTQASGADFAEQIAVEGNEASYEPGDVLVISPEADRVVELSVKAYDTTVLGVYSTDPAVLGGAPDTNNSLKGVPVAIIGIVKCKVSAENGPINRGDLLVTASLPGHAMRGGVNPPQGTVLGKAMQSLESGTGIILILVTLQ